MNLQSCDVVVKTMACCKLVSNLVQINKTVDFSVKWSFFIILLLCVLIGNCVIVSDYLSLFLLIPLRTSIHGSQLFS